MAPPPHHIKSFKHPYNSHKCQKLVTQALNARRMPSETKLSHSQLISLLLMLEPSDLLYRDFIAVANSFRSFPGAPYPNSAPHSVGLHTCCRWETSDISKTPIWLLDYSLSCLSGREYVFDSFPLCELGHASDHAYLIDRFLNHHVDPLLRRASPHNDHQHLEEYVAVHRKSLETTTRTVILYIPSCNIFFSVFSPMSSNRIDDLQQPMWSPLPSSWLRIRWADGQVAKGGFLSSIVQVYRIASRNSLHSKRYYQAHHLPDGKIWIPPDFVTNPLLCRAYPAKLQLQERRNAYHDLLLKSNTNRSLCKRTVPGLLYRNISTSPNILHLKLPTWPLDREINLRVVSHEHMSNIQAESTIRICRLDLSGHTWFEKHAKSLQRRLVTNKSHSVRNDNFSLGHMFAAGRHVHNGAITLYNRTYELNHRRELRQFMIEFRRLLDLHYPLQLASLNAQMRAFEEIPPPEMGGASGIVPSLNISLDLANEPHYDTNNLGIGIGVWLEEKPGNAKNWKFILPNLLVKYEGSTYDGLVVELCHGSLIQWDGGSIRHCTSVTDCGPPSNHMYGFHITKNYTSLKQYQEICLQSPPTRL
jgi:hypothetical protein